MSKGDVILILIIVGMIVGSGWLIFSINEQLKNTSYQMPNGVICQDQFTRAFGGGTTFRDCSDGYSYQDPSMYKTLEEQR